MQTFNIFDFLKDIVSRVSDLGGSVATADDHTGHKRRFVLWLVLMLLGTCFLCGEFCLLYIRKDDDNDNHEESKRNNKVIYQLLLSS